MIKRILWMALAGASAAVDHVSEPLEVIYASEAAGFRAQLRAGQFTFHDGRTAQTVTLKPCNEKIIREFWLDLVSHAQMLAADRVRAGETPKGATLKLDANEVAVGRYDSLYYYFNRLAKDAAIVLNQSAKACREVASNLPPDLQSAIDARTVAALDEHLEILAARIALLESGRTSVSARRAYHLVRALRTAADVKRPAADQDVARLLAKRWREVEVGAAKSRGPLSELRAEAAELRIDLGRPEAKLAAGWLDDAVAGEALSEQLPYRNLDLASRESFAHELAYARVVDEAFGDATLLSKFDVTSDPLADASTRSRVLREQRAALRSTKALRAQAHFTAEACATAYALSHAGPTQHFGHQAANSSGRVPAQAADGVVTEIKARLREGTARTQKRLKAWRALDAGERANRALVTLAADEPKTTGAAADRSCRALIE